MKIFLADTEATLGLGIALGESLPPGSVILLEGDLGAGKTTLVQGIGKGLGITEPIVSPTFTLINEYTEGRLPLYHLDLYRLEPQEVLSLNLESYWEGVEVTPGIVAIEWAERMPYKPDSYLSISLTYGDEGDRQAEITPFDCAIDKIIAVIDSRILQVGSQNSV
ncbi:MULTISPECIES: tRNA (adenosine(37)-N6)-threonylcarbamoyltransferase complex ATPase subunit type 1 TsaE [Nostoc]|uniref:tRNA threonylcarbamoyladenosine biosynthesis protein TsaE n=1 Tax=Nostoc paludosum FACHB-159 TaxID=2692908 RepID=A0ABR8K9W7_9NOSO|nr:MULTISPECIES: tRNA (adenosine(37)-N6)-threonylcarbamoyltransferase complex ATPase subunit type 1 TsaE [Nostoc]MBD2679220.1 tRNA (adenosine(37)-N6)-threonylcarbamoyltransferase complex ATPase subunit type 1 TsaE [Nostoc sp. FACHB-857]MBD2735601.1 tRNA (adenosine(37)-N6)-threonylcarbamoyltransferase complex ATPase subunit type 1 TsaE [Nostoc paludosum FACHB-159]